MEKLYKKNYKKKHFIRTVFNRLCSIVIYLSAAARIYIVRCFIQRWDILKTVTQRSETRLKNTLGLKETPKN